MRIPSVIPALILLACTTENAGPTSTGAPPAAAGPTDHAAGISWTVPADWKKQAQRPMRVATYALPAAGEMAVYFFGAGQGGGVDANIERWLGQIEQPDGRPSKELAKRDAFQVGEVRVTMLRVDGTYLDRPSPMAPTATPRPGYRLLAAVAEAKGGNVFFKLTAPVSGADPAAFRRILESIAPAP